ncbi:MAG: hypothetical protein H6Q66_1979 [Firmicutes bacterium]|nr:hypothetical protein [Bacillota bacterium]
MNNNVSEIEENQEQQGIQGSENISARPFQSQTLPDFPIESLPETLRIFANALALSYQTPVDLPALLIIATAAAVNAKNWIVRFSDDWTEPLNLYIAAAMEPANRKSSVFEECLKPLQRHEQEQLASMREIVLAAQIRKKILEAKIEKLIKKLSRSENGTDAAATQMELDTVTQELAAFNLPVLPKCIADDVTPEMLTSLLHEQAGKMAVLSAEGTLFNVIVGGMYSNGKGTPNIDVLLKAHSGDAIRVDRKGRPSEYINKPALTIGLAIQPDVLKGLITKPGLRGRGLLARFLYSLPASSIGYRAINPPSVPVDVRANYDTVIRSLLTSSMTTGGTTENGKEVRLSHDAGRRFNRYRLDVETKMRPFGDFSCISDWAGKLCGAVLRIAANLHLVRHSNVSIAEMPEISLDTMGNAIAIGDYLSQHAVAAYELMGANPVIDMATEIWDYIQTKRLERFSRRDIHAALRGRVIFKEARVLVQPLELLVERGCIRVIETEETEGPGRPSEQYEVNQELLNPNRLSSEPINEQDLEYRPPTIQQVISPISIGEASLPDNFEDMYHNAFSTLPDPEQLLVQA